MFFFFLFIFFFKQKTAYEMRISDWSSDVCSSDLIAAAFRMLGVHNRVSAVAMMQARAFDDSADETYLPGLLEERRGRPMLRRNFSGVSQISYRQIGRASCRERVCQYV